MAKSKALAQAARPTMPMRKKPSFVASVITGIVSIIGTLGTFAGVEVTVHQDPKPFEPPPGCITVLNQYKEMVTADKSVVEILTETQRDGRTILAQDANAVRCDITPIVVHQLAGK